VCRGTFGVAEDDPFGPDWGGISERDAKEVFADAPPSPTIAQVAHALGVTSAKVVVPPLSPATKLVLAGGSAILAVAEAFAKAPALSWTDQVVVVANDASTRQLAALAAVLLGARGRTILVWSRDAAAITLRAAGFAHVDAVVISDDAEPGAAEAAQHAGGA